MRTFTLRAALIAAAVLSSHPSLSQPRETVSIEVRYSDLDLSSPRDIERLHRRAHRAVVEACGSASDVRYLQLVKLVEACHASARSLLHQEILALLDRSRVQQASIGGGQAIRVSAAFAR